MAIRIVTVGGQLLLYILSEVRGPASLQLCTATHSANLSQQGSLSEGEAFCYY